MKKIALVTLVFVVLLAFVAVAMAGTVSIETNNFAAANQEKLTVEQARKIALKRVEGKIVNEFTIEDDEDNIVSYVFVIIDKNGKTFEVEVEAEKGTVVGVEEITEEDPPADENEVAEVIEIAEDADTDMTEAIAQPKISMEQAREAALKLIKGEIQSEELRSENGKVFYEIYIMDSEGDWFEVRVDGETGKAEKIVNPEVE